MKSKATLNYVQGDLFSGFGSDISVATANEVSKEVLSMPDAKVIFYRNFFNRKDSDELFQVLLEEINWRQDKMNVYGKEVNLPRKTAWYGDSNKSYTFSGIHLDPEPWTPTLLLVKERIEEVAEIEPRINLTFRLIID